MHLIKRVWVLLPVVILAGCATPEQYETPPVTVKTTKGTVTCQLYTPEILAWDRSIGRPNNMSVQEADSVCKAEGVRRRP